MTPREQLLKMQRIILRELKASVNRLQGAMPPDLARYSQAYKREFKTYQKISSKDELLKAIRDADIVFGADFHPFAQSQRTHLRLLRELVKAKRPVILALEAVDSVDQAYLLKFQQKKLDDQTFLRKIRYDKSWGFPWENYKVLFEFARDQNVAVFGINKSGLDNKKKDLERRDDHGAQKIAELRKRFPGALIYVIYGDLHLASTHLPKKTRKYLGKDDPARFVTIFQNSERLYFRLAEKKLEERVDVLKLRPDVYCVVNSPPWLKWQSYVSFLERDLDDRESETDGVDYNDDISHFIRIVQKIWEVKGSFTDFHVYMHGDMRVAQHLTRALVKKEALKIELLMRQGRSFFIPQPPLFYLKAFDVNSVAALSGQYIHAKVRREKAVHFDFPKDLSCQCWIEAVGFFASKVLNSRRKFVALRALPSTRQVTLLVLEQRLLEQVALKSGRSLRPVRRVRRRKMEEYLEASRIIGALLGNKIYTAFRSGEVDRETLHHWLKTPVNSQTEFTRFYVSVIDALKRIPLGERHQNERL